MRGSCASLRVTVIIIEVLTNVAAASLNFHHLPSQRALVGRHLDVRKVGDAECSLVKVDGVAKGWAEVGPSLRVTN